MQKKVKKNSECLERHVQFKSEKCSSFRSLKLIYRSLKVITTVMMKLYRGGMYFTWNSDRNQVILIFDLQDHGNRLEKLSLWS